MINICKIENRGVINICKFENSNGAVNVQPQAAAFVDICNTIFVDICNQPRVAALSSGSARSGINGGTEPEVLG